MNEVNEIVTAINGHTEATRSMSEALLADQRAARREQDRRFNKQTKKLHRLTWGLVAALVLLAGLIVQAKLDADVRTDRTRISEAQRRCDSILVDTTLARLSDLATATPNRVNGGGTDSAIQRLRADVAASKTAGPPDAALLARIRDEVAALLVAAPSDSPDLTRLRSEVATANQALVHVAQICYVPDPPADPFAG